MVRRKLLLVFLLVGLLSACASASRTLESMKESAETESSPSQQDAIRGVLLRGTPNNIGVKTHVDFLGTRERLAAVRFTSAANGWIASAKGKLYRTTDAGKTWKPVEIGNRTANYMVSLDFIGEKLGWAAFSRLPNDYTDPTKYQATILHTKDGGNTWLRQYEESRVAVNQVRFNDREGWATGVSYEQSQTHHLILHTTDFGEHWQNIASNFESAIGGRADRNFITDVATGSRGHATVLTVGGNMLETGDGGNGWRAISTIEDEPQVGFIKLGEMKDRNTRRV